MQSRGWTFLFLPIAADNHKTQRKEAEDKGVFFWFGDDLAVEGDLQRTVAARRKPGILIASTIIRECSRKEVANGFVDDAGAHPNRRLPVGIGQSVSGDANSHPIFSVLILHKKASNGSASAGDGDGGRVGGAGGKGDVGFASARNSGGYGLDVFSVGTGKQGRQRERLGVWLVGVVNVS